MMAADLYCIWMDECEAVKKYRERRGQGNAGKEETDSLIDSDEPGPERRKRNLKKEGGRRGNLKVDRGERTLQGEAGRYGVKKESRKYKEGSKLADSDDDDDFDIGHRTVKKEQEQEQEQELGKRDGRRGFREDVRKGEWDKGTTVKKEGSEGGRKGLKKVNVESIMGLGKEREVKKEEPMRFEESDLGSFDGDSDSILSLSREVVKRENVKPENAKNDVKQSKPEENNALKTEKKIQNQSGFGGRDFEQKVKPALEVGISRNRRRTRLIMSDSDSD